MHDTVVSAAFCDVASTADADDPGSAPGDPEQPPSASSTSPVIDIVADEDTPLGKADRAWLADRMQAGLEHIEASVARWCVRLVGDAVMTRLHAQHCNIDDTTDVLTFPTAEHPQPIDVDIAVCIDEARRQADRHGHPWRHEVLLYALHGLLHCAGFDDHDDDDFARMHAQEDAILTALGIGPTFARGPSGHDDDRATRHRDRDPSA
jgi:probable rRNA maturation factor